GQLFDEGIITVAAAGNDTHATIKPPASSPKVIAVGGIDDENRLDVPVDKLYHSSFGNNKPDLTAHAIWIAAPILPGTQEQEEAKKLFIDIDDRKKEMIRSRKFISPHYMHVDGTSFAAPIVSGIIAQLLEINPSLTPARIREILFSTARRLPDAAPERQG